MEKDATVKKYSHYRFCMWLEKKHWKRTNIFSFANPDERQNLAGHNAKYINFKHDSGAEEKQTIRKTKVKQSLDRKIQFNGKYNLQMMHRKMEHVVKRKVKPILVLKACEKIQMIKRMNRVKAVNKDDNPDDLLSEYIKMYEGEHKLRLEETVV